MSKSVASDYWIEAVSIACEEAGVEISSEQLDAVAKSIQTSAEMERECSGYYAAPNPDRAEIKRLETALDSERRKIACQECGGSGRIQSYGPHHCSDSQCWKCRGEGKVSQ